MASQGPVGPASAASSGSGSAWSNPTNALADDGSYAVASITDGCPLAGTAILDPDGAWIPVEALEVGSRLLAGDGSIVRVTKLEPLEAAWSWAIRTSEGPTVRVTGDHLFGSGGKWTRAMDLAAGAFIDLPYGTIEVLSAEKVVHDPPATAYRVEVEEPHTYYAAGLLSHNK